MVLKWILYSCHLIFGRQASTRFICSIFSLPVPPGNPNRPKEDPTTFSGRSMPEYLEQGRIQKLLLFGLEGSGTSTIFKQVHSCFITLVLTFFITNIHFIRFQLDFIAHIHFIRFYLVFSSFHVAAIIMENTVNYTPLFYVIDTCYFLSLVGS